MTPDTAMPVALREYSSVTHGHGGAGVPTRVFAGDHGHGGAGVPTRVFVGDDGHGDAGVPTDRPKTVRVGFVHHHGHGSAVTLPIALDGEEMDASMTTDTAMPMSLPIALNGGRWMPR